VAITATRAPATKPICVRDGELKVGIKVAQTVGLVNLFKGHWSRKQVNLSDAPFT